MNITNKNYKKNSFIFFDISTENKIIKYFSDLLDINIDDLITQENNNRDYLMDNFNMEQKNDLIICVPPFMKKTNEIYPDDFDIDEEIIIKYILSTLNYNCYAFIQMPTLFLYCDKYSILRNDLFDKTNVFKINFLTQNEDPIFNRKTCILHIINSRNSTRQTELIFDDENMNIKLPQNRKINPIFYKYNLLLHGNQELNYLQIKKIGYIDQNININDNSLYISSTITENCISYQYSNNDYVFHITDNNFKKEYIYEYILRNKDWVKKIYCNDCYKNIDITIFGEILIPSLSYKFQND